MAKISIRDLRHSYLTEPKREEDWALKRISLECGDSGAYALLGPSGCGKTTLLSLISGLLRPTEGRIFFDERDVTEAIPEKRNIAQVFQFPVIYDTMSIRDNVLDRRAAGLTADGKQKISLGRGLVRTDVNVIMFDEPLTVIDPHLKWQLRSKLKELHHKTRRTMIYVTHDQTEALTFAEQVVVMKDGLIVQIGTPVELFERPRHTFVGHFIGSPGMNVLPCEIRSGQAFIGEHAVKTVDAKRSGKNHLQLGVRPEFVSFAAKGIPVEVIKVADAGRFRIVETKHARHSIKLLVPEGAEIPASAAHIHFDPSHTQVYEEGWMIE